MPQQDLREIEKQSLSSAPSLERRRDRPIPEKKESFDPEKGRRQSENQQW